MNSSASSSLARKALMVHRRLLREYGERPWSPHRPPLDQLIMTILSQNTSDVNRDRAWRQLKARFPSWEDVLRADTESVAEAIKPAGLSRIRAPRIQEILRRIERERGELSLDFLADMEVDEARQWLLSLPGVGPKTAAIVLLFSLGKPAFPVDTHIHRVARRLGLISPTTSANAAHALLETLLPPEAYYSFHLNLIAHGRAVCRARRPLCHQCALREWCDYSHEKGAGREDDSRLL